MKISKLLNKNYLSIFIILFILLNSFVAAEDEPVDIWNLEKKLEENKSEIVLQDNDISVNSTIQIQTNQSNEFEIVGIKSPIDGVFQKAYFYKTKSNFPQPLIVSLHTWSYNYTQFDSINEQSAEKDYNYIHPDFRGANNSKNACCSELRQFCD